MKRLVSNRGTGDTKKLSRRMQSICMIVGFALILSYLFVSFEKLLFLVAVFDKNKTEIKNDTSLVEVTELTIEGDTARLIMADDSTRDASTSRMVHLGNTGRDKMYYSVDTDTVIYESARTYAWTFLLKCWYPIILVLSIGVFCLLIVVRKKGTQVLSAKPIRIAWGVQTVFVCCFGVLCFIVL